MMNREDSEKNVSPATTRDGAVTRPNRQRRRPRKLNKEPAMQKFISTTAEVAALTPTSAATNVNEPSPPVSTLELEALKSRVHGLEARVEELYNNSTDAQSARLLRRRGKVRKGSSATQIPTLSTSSTKDTVTITKEEEADEELVRLEGELEIARQDLETYRPRIRPRTRTRRSTSKKDDDDIEEIPRVRVEHSTAMRDTVNTGDRQVTLTGNYRIPLPASVSMTDVKNIQTGVSAAQNVAKSFIEQRRAQAKQNTLNKAYEMNSQAPKAGGKAAASATMSTETRGESSKSWAEWVGGYSMAISRVVRNIEAEAALETQKAGARTPAQARPLSAKTTTTTKGNAITKSEPRPPLKPRAGNLSTEQLQGLMK